MKGIFEQNHFFAQLCLLAIVFFCCNLLATSAITGFLLLTDIEDPTGRLRAALFIQNSIVFAGSALMAQYILWKEPARTFLHLNKPSVLPLVLGCMCMLFSGPVVDMLNTWNQGLHLPSGMESLEAWMISSEKEAEALSKQLLETDSWGGLAANLVVMALLAGLGEELLFRGVLQPFCIKWTKNMHAGVFIAAFIFSAIHLQFFGFLPRLVSGILLGYLYIASRNLWVPVAAHAINNLWVILFTPNTLNSGCKLVTEINNVENNSWLVLSGLVLSAGCLYLVWKKSQDLASSN